MAEKPLKGVMIKWQLTDIGCLYGTCLMHKDAVPREEAYRSLRSPSIDEPISEGLVMRTSRVIHLAKDANGVLIAETLNSRYILL